METRKNKTLQTAYDNLSACASDLNEAMNEGIANIDAFDNGFTELAALILGYNHPTLKQFNELKKKYEELCDE